MKLYEAIGIKKEHRECIAVVGGGGKTTALFRLAKELKVFGCKVAATTTTKIFYPDHYQYDGIVISTDKQECIDFLNRSKKPGVYVLGNHLMADNKLVGHEDSTICELYVKSDAGHIVVEADGAKHKPVKAPGAHEPVIPRCTTIVIGIIGLDCLGKPVNDDIVHRVDAFCSICGCMHGDTLSIEHLIKLIRHPAGLFKNTPDSSKRVVILNKAEDESRLAAAKKIKKILEEAEQMNVLFASLQKEECIIE